MSETDPLKVAVRAWTVRLDPPRDGTRKQKPPKKWPWKIQPTKGPVPKLPAIRQPERLLVVDFETTIEPEQRLSFGSYRYFEIVWEADVPHLFCREEGLVYGDDLEDRDPHGYAVLRDFARHKPADVDGSSLIEVQPNLGLLSREEFVETVLWDACFKPGGEHFERAPLVAFNMGFDLSRIAWDDRGKEPSHDWTLILGGYWTKEGGWKESPSKPRVRITHIDTKRALKRFMATGARDLEDMFPEHLNEPYEDYHFRGHLLDLRTLGFALRNRGFTLGTACEAFGVANGKIKAERHGVITPEYIAYNRNDVRATAELSAKMMQEFLAHPIDLAAEQAFSPATIATSYLREMGITPALDRLGETPAGTSWDEVFGACMASYYGGRAECRIRRTPVPVVLLDFTSMYPTVQTLMNLEEFLTCRTIDVVEEDVGELERFIGALSPDDLFDKGLWPKLRSVVQVDPAPGDVLPIRARYGGENAPWGIGLNAWAETPDSPFWYSLPDVIGSFLRTERVPRILRALRFVPRGQADGLQQVMFRSAVSIDPTEGIFGPMVQERMRIAKEKKGDEGKKIADALKVVANSGSYGVFARMDRKEDAKESRMEIHGLRSYEWPTRNPEDPGPFCFPPAASLITGSARLLLTMLEGEITKRGGVYAACDTDSMFVVATRHGEVAECEGGKAKTPEGVPGIKTLSWAQINRIVRRFDGLSPYDDELVEHLLKVEDVNHEGSDPKQPMRNLLFLGPSSKRYALFEMSDGGPEIVDIADPAGRVGGDVEDESGFEIDVTKLSEHGLGHLLNPIDPASEDRDWLKAAWGWMLRRELVSTSSELAFLDLPAVTRTSISSPAQMKPFLETNGNKHYADRMKPFNFLISCIPDLLHGAPPEADPQRFRLVTPYEDKPANWVSLPWRDAHTGTKYAIATVGDSGPGVVRVKTYRQVFEEHLGHEEAKSLAPDGGPCRKDTTGLLGRRAVSMLGQPRHIGKEGNKLEARLLGEVVHEQDFQEDYGDPEWDDFVTIVRPALSTFSAAALAEQCGLDESTVKRVRSGRSNGSLDSRRALTEVAANLARGRLRRLGKTPPSDDVRCLQIWSEFR